MVYVAGGATIAQQALSAGLVDAGPPGAGRPPLRRRRAKGALQARTDGLIEVLGITTHILFRVLG
jgi:hypothetical protein